MFEGLTYISCGWLDAYRKRSVCSVSQVRFACSAGVVESMCLSLTRGFAARSEVRALGRQWHTILAIQTFMRNYRGWPSLPFLCWTAFSLNVQCEYCLARAWGLASISRNLVCGATWTTVPWIRSGCAAFGSSVAEIRLKQGNDGQFESVIRLFVENFIQGSNKNNCQCFFSAGHQCITFRGEFTLLQCYDPGPITISIWRCQMLPCPGTCLIAWFAKHDVEMGRWDSIELDFIWRVTSSKMAWKQVCLMHAFITMPINQHFLLSWGFHSGFHSGTLVVGVSGCNDLVVSAESRMFWLELT